MVHSTAHAAAIALALSFGGEALGQQPVQPGDPTAREITVTGRAAPASPLVGPNDFISPMGEPFRSDDKLSGAEHWFAQADADHDGRLTRLEFRADAARFFATLDTDHDGVIGPNELEHYETDVAPEVIVVSTYGDMSKATTDSDGKVIPPPYPTRLGAGRFGYLAAPEPVAAADANLDRGVTTAEFAQAADSRFKLLDRNGDGAIVRAELPRLGSPRDGR